MANKKSKEGLDQFKESMKDHEAPHHYASKDGVHVFHGFNDSHKKLVGIHLQDPSDDEVDSAVKEAKESGSRMVFVHGRPPRNFMSKIHPTLGAISKSERLEKAYLHRDGDHVTDAGDHAHALEATNDEFLEWGSNNLSPLGLDDIAALEFHGHIIKVRKHDSDLYSGWIEKNGEKIHEFKGLTMPQTMLQLQSKLELYGKKKEKVVADNSEHDDISSEDISEKIKNLHDKITDMSEDSVDVTQKELEPGMKYPEENCPACEMPGQDCVCYNYLPKPRLEFDGKKVTVFFKSEWAQEDKENFIDDLKNRARYIMAENILKKLSGKKK